MAFPLRSCGPYERVAIGNNNQQQPVLSVTPLNSLPYIAPPTSESTSSAPSRTQRETEAAEKTGPSMIFLPSDADPEEWDNLVAHAKNGVAVTGSAAMGTFGPSIGRVDIAETEDSYHFSVSLPGVSRDERDFSCAVEPDGSVLVTGITTTGEKTVCKHSQVFKMLSRNLCPPGHFTVSFNLPGPVDHEQFQGHFGTDGILEGLVKKR